MTRCLRVVELLQDLVSHGLGKYMLQDCRITRGSFPYAVQNTISQLRLCHWVQ